MKKFILMLDASALKLLPCAQKFYNTVLLGYRSAVNSNDIEYGSAFHLFVKIMVDSNGDYSKAIPAATEYFKKVKKIVKPKKEWMTEQHLVTTCMNYWENYNRPQKDVWQTVRHNGKALTELKFATLPYYTDDRPFTLAGVQYSGIEILLTGTIDDICKREGGCYALRDYKTTSVWDIDSYLQGYQSSAQLKFYAFVTYWYARQYPQSTYPESPYAEILAKGRIGAFIDGVFLKSGKSASEQTSFKRSNIFVFSENELAYFKKGIDEVAIPKILAMLHGRPYEEGLLSDTCKIVYGECEFFHSCTAMNSEMKQQLLDTRFIKKSYNPLQFS